MNKIRLSSAFDGDIIKVVSNEYDENIVTNKWGLHFVDRIRFYKIVKVSNNGSAFCKGFDGKTKWFSLSTDKTIVAAYTHA